MSERRILIQLVWYVKVRISLFGRSLLRYYKDYIIHFALHGKNGQYKMCIRHENGSAGAWIRWNLLWQLCGSLWKYANEWNHLQTKGVRGMWSVDEGGWGNWRYMYILNYQQLSVTATLFISRCSRCYAQCQLISIAWDEDSGLLFNFRWFILC